VSPAESVRCSPPIRASIVPADEPQPHAAGGVVDVE
jgi:hypothetical protein